MIVTQLSKYSKKMLNFTIRWVNFMVHKLYLIKGINFLTDENVYFPIEPVFRTKYLGFTSP